MLQLSNQDILEVKQLVELNYYKAMHNKKEQIREFHLSLYGFIPQWFERQTTEVFIKIKEFMELSNVKVEEIKKGIQKYLGYAASLFYFQDGKKLPIPLKRIERALLLIDNKAHKVQVEQALYF
jgi:predicted Zn-dependent protease with MMP-like domain